MITLQPYRQEDLPVLFSWINTAQELMQFAGPQLQFPLTKEQLVTVFNNPQKFPLAIHYHEQLIGYAEISTSDEYAHLGRIIIGEKDLRGKGLCRYIMESLLQICTAQLGKSLVYLNVFDWNSAAIKCYERAGFKTTGKKTERQIGEQKWTAVQMMFRKDQN